MDLREAKVIIEYDWWIKELNLAASNLEDLLNGSELTDSIINASQRLLSEQHPHLVGFWTRR